MIDTHCHLTANEFDVDRAQVIERAKNANITAIMTIANDLQDSKSCRLLSAEYEQIFYTIGIHPSETGGNETVKELQEGLMEELSHAGSRLCGIGETGLEYHYLPASKQRQQEVCAMQIEIAKGAHLPVILHCREAIADLHTLLRQAQYPKAVIHCCTEKWEDVEELVNQGMMLSFGGIVTFSNAKEVHRTVAQCPLSQLLLETDAPFLAPVPHRGKRNESQYIPLIAQTIADIKGISFEEVARQTTHNALSFFQMTSLRP